MLSDMCATGGFLRIGENSERDGRERTAAMALLDTSPAVSNPVREMGNDEFLNGLIGKVFENNNFDIRFCVSKAGSSLTIHYQNTIVANVDGDDVVSEIKHGDCPGTYTVYLSANPNRRPSSIYNASNDGRKHAAHDEDCNPIGGTWTKE